jgi:hypothetical protein
LIAEAKGSKSKFILEFVSTNGGRLAAKNVAEAAFASTEERRENV